MSTPKPTIYVKQIPVGPMMNFAYLAGPANDTTAILIDPCWDAPALIEAAKKDGRSIDALFITHSHFDHVNALEDVAERVGAPIYVHEAEACEFDERDDITTTREGSVIEVAGLSITCLATPGHSPGSQCLLIGNALFTGDTLFVEGCGRVDLMGGSPQQMRASLKRLANLPDDIIVFPGHNYGGSPTSTIGEQKHVNPYMKDKAKNTL